MRENDQSAGAARGTSAAPAGPCQPMPGERQPVCMLCGVRYLDGERASLPAAIDSAVPALEIRLREGQALYLAGQRGDAVFVLRSGLVKETMRNDAGEERIVRLVAAGGATGLPAVLHQPHRHSAHVLHGGSACRIPVAALQRLAERRPDLIEGIVAQWQGALDDADQVIAGFSTGAGRERLARFLLYIAEHVGVPDDGVRIRRRDVAELIGVTPVSVTRLIGDFKAEGLMTERDEQLVAIDAERLRALAAG